MGHMRTRGRQSGAALLLALLIMTLVATLAAGMVWLQWRGIEVEAAERARTQAEWLLNASLDWGNLILKSSARNSYLDDDLGQPWATPLAETKLSSFLSADGNHQDDTGPEAYLSGQITDAQSKYNLYNLVVDSQGKFVELQRLQLLFTAIGVSPDVAGTIATGLRASYSALQQQKDQSGQPDQTNAVVMPVEVADLVWYGVDPKVLKTIAPFVQLIPIATGGAVTPINANTAPAEVIMAGCGLPAISRAQAEAAILKRQSAPFQSIASVMTGLGLGPATPDFCVQPGPADSQPKNILAWKSQYFEIYGQLRYEQHVIRERSVVYRKDQYTVQVLRRERLPPDPVAAATGA